MKHMPTAALRRESQRQAARASTQLVDTPRDPLFDAIVFTAAQLFRTPIALLPLIGEQGVWLKAAVGPIRPVWEHHHEFCTMAATADRLLHIEDSQVIAIRPRNQMDQANPVRFCAAAPIRRPDGRLAGSLCVMDHQPRSLSERQRNQLEQLARDAAAILEIHTHGLDLMN